MALGRHLNLQVDYLEEKPKMSITKRPSSFPARRGSGTRRAVTPTGKCWCGCGEATEPEAFFLPGHDRKAEAALVKDEYGSLAEMLDAHGWHGQKRRKTA